MRQHRNYGWLSTKTASLLVLAGMMAIGAVAQVDPGNYPTNAVEIKLRNPSAQDGLYVIDGDGPGGNPPFVVYCYDMAGNPKEYVELARVGEGTNYGMGAAGGPYPGTDVFTHFSKLRIDPRTLEVQGEDYTFSISRGSYYYVGSPDSLYKIHGYAGASDCIAPGSAQGRANVDLRSTPFALADSVTFQIGGWEPAGSFTISPDRKVADLQGGGYCGGCGPAGALTFKFSPWTNSPRVQMIDFGPKPDQQTRTNRDSMTFIVAATGDAPLTYQWQRDGTNMGNGGRVSGATNCALNLAELQPADAGSYSVVVSNSYGAVTSRVSTLMVVVDTNPPTIVSRPLPYAQVTYVGGNVLLKALATGARPLAYQWQMNGVTVSDGGRISGATTAILRISGADAIDAGDYTLVVTNILGAVTSAPAILQVETDLAHRGYFNVATDFSSTANPNGVWSYGCSLLTDNDFTAYQKSEPVPNSTCSAWSRLIAGDPSINSLPHVMFNAGDTTYNTGTVSFKPHSVFFHPGSGRERSVVRWTAPAPGTAQVAVSFEGADSVGPTATDVHVLLGNGQSVFDAAVNGFGPPSAVSWQGPIPMGFGDTIDFVLGSGPGGDPSFDTTLLDATVILYGTNSPPVLICQPTNQTVVAGGSGLFSVSAIGVGSLTYQWRFNGVDLPGETNATLTLSAVQANQFGNYSVAVSNAFGGVISSEAALSFIPPNTILLEEFSGTCAGNAYGITYAPALDGLGAVFWRTNEGRIQYPFGAFMPTEGTLEWWVKVDSGYYYYNYLLHPGEPSATIFTTDIQCGDVTWPGSTWLTVGANGDISLAMRTAKYGLAPSQDIAAQGTSFRFGEWHAIGMSFGSHGQYLMLDGQLVASNATNTQVLGAGGQHDYVCDVPTIGESVSCFWDNNQYEGGFEGMVDRFRISSAQQDWFLAAAPAGSSSTNPPTISSQPQDQMRAVGGSVTFDVQAYGAWPLAYQWQFNGANLNDGDRITGTMTATLLISALQINDAGNYSVVVSNAFGSVTSAVAVLTVQPTPPNPDPERLAFIPEGTFQMGDTFGDPGQVPVHWVYISAFYMDKYDVTKVFWDEVYNWATNHGYSFDNPGSYYDGAFHSKGTNHPVQTVSWYDCVKWCNARSEKEGRTPAYYTSVTQATVYRNGQVDVQSDRVKWNVGYRLPTEAEWEKAARGGASGHRFPWSDVDTITHSRANYFSDSVYTYDVSPTRGYHPAFTTGGLPYTSPVDYFAPNGYGLYSMAGNVFQWCWDWGWSSYDASSLSSDPRGPASGSVRIYRGGCFAYGGAQSCRTAGAGVSLANVPDHCGYSVGFRSVLADLSSTNPPAISRQPQDQTRAVGGSVIFDVQAYGTWPLTYQWQFNGANLNEGGRITGTMTATLSISPVQTNDAGNYSVVVSNTYGLVTSSNALVAVVPLLITTQPQSQQSWVGGTVTFTVSVQSALPVTYQWRFNGVDMSGETSATLTLSAVQANQFGNYSVAVSNAFGGVISSEAALSRTEVVAWGWYSNGRVAIPAIAPAGLTNVLAVASGADHSLVLRADGTVVAWGHPDYGQTDVPSGLSNVVAIAAFMHHNLALMGDGTVVAWGSYWVNGGQTVTVTVPANLTNVVAIACGEEHSLALKADGTVVAWGYDCCGQTDVPSGLSNVVAIAAGENLNLVLLADGSLVTWGANIWGPMAVPLGLTNVVAVAAGFTHDLALKGDGTVAAWGAGSINSGTYPNYGQCIVPTDLTNVLAVSAGNEFNLALRADGTLAAWGRNDWGQTDIPSGLTNVTGISAGAAHGIALLANESAGSAGTGRPFLTTPIVSRTAIIGTTVQFYMLATGARPVSYQWQLNGTNIPAATNHILGVVTANSTDAGDYRLIVANAFGSVTSAVARLTVVPLIITTQPQSQQSRVGSSVTFTVSVQSALPVTYQWRFNEVDLPGQTNATLTLTSVTSNQVGHYSVLVSNAHGAVTSTVADLTIAADYFTEWASPNDLAYQSFTFTPDGSGTSYSACRMMVTAFPTDPTGGMALPLDDDDYALVGLSGANTVAIYGRRTNAFFIGSNGYLTFDWGDDEYDESLADHFALPRISGLFHDLDPSSGGTISWQQFADRAVVTYVDVPEYDSSATVNVQIEMFYDGRIRLSYLGLGVTGGLVGLSAGQGVPTGFLESDFTSYQPCRDNLPPEISTQLASQTAVAGATVHFSVGIFGSLPLSYQWRFNGLNLPAETNAMLTLTSVTMNQAGYYSVLVSNAYGTVLSSSAALTVVTGSVAVAYFTDNNPAATGPETPITTAGFVPLHIFDIATQNLASITILFIDEYNNSGLSSPLLTRLPEIQSWVSSGGKLIVHDRAAGYINPNPFLLGATGTVTTRFETSDVDVVPPGANLVVAGPFGTINNTTLDGGNDSAHGYVAQNQLPSNATPILSVGGAPANVVGFSYALGAGMIYYSSIPLDCYLAGGACTGNTIASALQNIYTPNVLLYTASYNSCSNCPPSIVPQPQSQQAWTGGSATFSVSVQSNQPVAYQWYKDGTGLVDDGHISGAMSDHLTIVNVQANDAGFYSVLVSNAYGAVFSSSARLGVVAGLGTVAVFDDPRYVHTTSGSPFAESDNVQASLTNRGFRVVTFTDIVATTPAQSVLLFPAEEVSPLGPALSLAQRSALSNFVAAGGLMILHGSYMTSNSADLLNRVFGLAVQEASVGSGLFNRTSQAAGTAFTNVPASLVSQDASDILRTVSLPTGARSIYETNGLSLVAEMSCGNGKIIFLGWDWYNAAPLGTQDGGWLAVLESAVREGRPLGPQPPVIFPQPASQTVRPGTNVTFRVATSGLLPLNYQWRKDGLTLADGGNISGAMTATLTLSNVFGGDAGSYSVLVRNEQGSVASTAAVLTVIDPSITGQPATQQHNSGESVTLSVTAVGTALNYQWWKDGLALAQGTGPALTLTNLQGSDAGFYMVVVSNRYGRVTSTVAVLTVNLAVLDGGFNPGAGGTVYSLAVQVDGKVLVGGMFSTLGGQPRSRIGRLNVDGTLDSGFDPGANSYVTSFVVQNDGKILVGGAFTSLGGQPHANIARLNADGSLDSGFNLGASSAVFALAEQADGKILVGGFFNTVGGQPRTNMARLNMDGTADAGFKPWANGAVSALAMQADGRILLGGVFTTVSGQPRTNMARLNVDGTLDNTFNPGAGNRVLALTVQADGKIIVGGYFTNLAGQPRTYLARLNPDGTLDGAFNPGVGGGSSPCVSTLVVQADGKILVGGAFTNVAGQPRNYLARLNADGTVDNTFKMEADNAVQALALQAEGNVLVGGAFTNIAGQPCNYLARLMSVQPGTQSLNYDGSTVTWLRAGTSPEVWRTSFEQSTDGLNWASLGAGTRIPGGWQLGGVFLPPGGTIRARGYVTGGRYNGSAWFVETLLQPAWAVILTRDGNFGIISNRFGFNIHRGGTQMVVVEASTDLRNWTPVSTNALDHGTFYFCDPDCTAAPQRFYRLRSK